jgi:hypothetical protein
MPSEVFRRLSAYALPIDEIEDVVGWHFQHAEWGDGFVEYAHGFPGVKVALTLALDETNHFCDAVAGPGLRETDIPAIEEELRKLSTSSRLTYVRQIILASVAVRRAFRYRDEFQILPMPPGSPQPVELMADWPCLLEFTYLGSHHSVINQRRNNAALSKLVSLLNALNASHIFSPPNGRKSWVMTGGRGGYLQLGYPMSAPFGPIFSDISKYELMPLVPANRYQLHMVDSSLGMAWADDIHEMLDFYHAMAETDRERFDTAAHWYGRYPELHEVSDSAGLVALVTSLEALAPKAEALACATCGHVGSVMRGYRVLLDEAAPGHSEAKDQFYKLRSRVAHGSSLLLNEFRSMGGGSAAQLQQHANDRLEELVHLTLRNWLIPEVREAIAARAANPHDHAHPD